LLELDNLCHSTLYLPITTGIMRRAAELWADARKAGRPTAGNESLDVDVILLSQAETLDDEYRIVTTNGNHFATTGLALDWNTELSAFNP
jgi:predicted nucleic acid-binding protein